MIPLDYQPVDKTKREMRRRIVVYSVGYLMCGIVISMTAWGCSEHAFQKAKKRENRVLLYGIPNEAEYRRNIVQIPSWTAVFFHASVCIGGLIHVRRKRMDDAFVVIVIASQCLTGYLTIFSLFTTSDRSFP